ncbi:hypothetical protein [Sporosarcina obsidiansis]|uniref:hypothetical protein n=1 Tax=Sporosarcina obsidiansis TaxID=2660748 RepID=UPI00129AAD07|nr:hypothetical protein [Sporosarcina obsidiansis]
MFVQACKPYFILDKKFWFLWQLEYEHIANHMIECICIKRYTECLRAINADAKVELHTNDPLERVGEVNRRVV